MATLNASFITLVIFLEIPQSYAKGLSTSFLSFVLHFFLYEVWFLRRP